MKIIIHPVVIDTTQADLHESQQRKQDELDKEATRLYNARCMLSNRLRVDNGNALIVAENVRLIEEMLRLEQQRKIVRADYFEDRVERPKIGPHVVFAPKISYTMVMLEELSYMELHALREKLRFQRGHLQKKLATLKTPDARVDVTREIESKQREIDLVDDIRRKLKNGTT